MCCPSALPSAIPGSHRHLFTSDLLSFAAGVPVKDRPTAGRASGRARQGGRGVPSAGDVRGADQEVGEPGGGDQEHHQGTQIVGDAERRTYGKKHLLQSILKRTTLLLGRNSNLIIVARFINLIR